MERDLGIWIEIIKKFKVLYKVRPYGITPDYMGEVEEALVKL